MKFIVDVMLGRLAKRMRLLGFDVLYDRTLGDNEVIRLALEGDRVILTRDASLAARPLATNHLLITSDFVREQVEQVLSVFSLDTLRPLTRCSMCNDRLDTITKEEARDFVPRYVYEKKGSFLRCPRCGRTYWKGTHVQRMALPREK
jgi:uncharacterized protein